MIVMNLLVKVELIEQVPLAPTAPTHPGLGTPL